MYLYAAHYCVGCSPTIHSRLSRTLSIINICALNFIAKVLPVCCFTSIFVLILTSCYTRLRLHYETKNNKKTFEHRMRPVSIYFLYYIFPIVLKLVQFLFNQVTNDNLIFVINSESLLVTVRRPLLSLCGTPISAAFDIKNL